MPAAYVLGGGVLGLDPRATTTEDITQTETHREARNGARQRRRDTERRREAGMSSRGCFYGNDRQTDRQTDG